MRAMRSALILAVVVASLLGACDASTASPSARPVRTGEPPTNRVPIIIDTDLDLSDIGALAVLLRDPALDVRAVTIAPTGTGVTNCDSARLVMRYVLERFGAATTPFACGRADPGPDGVRFPDDLRGAADTGWGLAIGSPPGGALPADAVTLLARAVNTSPSAPTIVALGPWTNLEDAVTADPSIPDRIAGIHAMGGAVDVPGNATVGDATTAEWNFASDPSAVSAVFATEAPISLVPLDATVDVPVPPDLADRLAADHAAAGADLLYELLQLVPSRAGGEEQQLWDELAALTVSATDLVTWEEATLVAEDTGRIVQAEAGRPVRFATTADREAVEAAFLAALRTGPPAP